MAADRTRVDGAPGAGRRVGVGARRENGRPRRAAPAVRTADISWAHGDSGPRRGDTGRWHEMLIRRRVKLPAWLRFSRYTIGSAICFGVSEVVFVALFAPGILGSKGAAIVASIAGIIPGYFLNRSWTWGRTGRSDFWREVVPYWATALISTALAALGTGAANEIFAAEPRGVRTVINAGAYMLVYGVLFIAKYVIFHRWLFAPARTAATATATGEGATG